MGIEISEAVLIICMGAFVRELVERFKEIGEKDWSNIMPWLASIAGAVLFPYLLESIPFTAAMCLYVWGALTGVHKGLKPLDRWTRNGRVGEPNDGGDQ